VKVRRLLGATAIISSILGALVVYLVLTVPNDLKADALLKDARKHLAAGKTAEAHDALSSIVQHHPRTDAAAAATVALVKLADQERARLEVELKRLRTENENQTKALNDLRKTVDGIKNAPPPKPVEVKPAPARKPPPKKPAPKRRTTSRRRRG
jgi:hypothetical protein